MTTIKDLVQASGASPNAILRGVKDLRKMMEVVS